MFNLVCEFSNNSLHESPVHYDIQVHKSWKLHQIFKFCFLEFWYLFNINFFLKLHKEDATTTPIASYRVLVIVNKAPCPQFHQKSSNNIQKSTFLHFFYFIYIFTYIFLFFTILMWIGFQWCVSTYCKSWCGKVLKRHALEFILVIKFGWSKLSIWGDQLWNPITTKHWLILSLFFFSYGSIYCTPYNTTFMFPKFGLTQEYVMAFWMKTFTKSTWFCWSL